MRQGRSTGIYDKRFDIFRTLATGVVYIGHLHMPRDCMPKVRPVQVTPMDRINYRRVQLEEIFQCISLYNMATDQLSLPLEEKTGK